MKYSIILFLLVLGAFEVSAIGIGHSYLEEIIVNKTDVCPINWVYETKMITNFKCFDTDHERNCSILLPLDLVENKKCQYEAQVKDQTYNQTEICPSAWIDKSYEITEYVCPVDNRKRDCLATSKKDCIYRDSIKRVFGIHRGETKEFILELQNGEDQEMRVALDLNSENDVAYIIDKQDEYILPPNNRGNIKVRLHINAPDGAEIGNISKITYGMSGTGSWFTTGIGGQEINVQLINEKPTKPILIYPTGGEKLSGTQYITWNASADEERDPITYLIEYSSDKEEWYTLKKDIKDTRYKWKTHFLKNGNYFIRVMAFDGYDYSEYDITQEEVTIKNIPYMLYFIIIFILVLASQYEFLKNKFFGRGKHAKEHV